MKKKKDLIKTNTTTTSLPQKAIIIVIFIALLFAFMYFLTTRILAKENKNEKDKSSKETTIQYDKILAGESFNIDREEYYVLYYDSSDDKDNLSSLISTYQLNTSKVRLYSVDLHDGMNKKYITESDIVTDSPSELRVKNNTLLKFKDKKVVEIVDNKDDIKEYLSK